MVSASVDTKYIHIHREHRIQRQDTGEIPSSIVNTLSLKCRRDIRQLPGLHSAYKYKAEAREEERIKE